MGRLSAVKVVLLKLGERGVPLASRDKVGDIFRSRGLEPIWAESLEAIPENTLVIVSTGAPVGEEVLARTPRLQLVAVAFTGVDHIDLVACKSRGVTVVNVPGYSTDATAELALGMVLSHLRRLPQCHQTIKDGTWACPPQEDLQSKVIGIVGVGKIGLRLTELFSAFRVSKILGYSTSKDPQFTALGGKYIDSLAGLFLDADIICICVPLTKYSAGLVSEKLMELLSPTNLLVNVSRGGVVDERALATFTGQGRFRAALDVFSVEPLPKDSPLRAVPPDNLIMTPHVGYQSMASLEKRLDATVKNILAFLVGQAINIAT